MIHGNIERADELAHRKWIRSMKALGKGYDPPVRRLTLLEALSDAREGMTQDERREHLINCIIRGRKLI